MVADPPAAAGAVTEADRCLQAALAERGLSATPTQFKRWRHARLLDSPERPGAGRGRGRPSRRYPDTAVAQAITIIELLKLHVPLREMALAMFLRGAPIGVEPVRKALQVILTAGGAGSLTHLAGEDAADAYIARLRPRARRHPVLRHWARRAARSLPGRAAGHVSDMVTAVVDATATKSQPSTEAVKTTATVLDLDEAETTAIFERISQIPLHTFGQVAETVTLTELTDAKRRMEETFSEGGDDEQKPDFKSAGLILLGFVAVARMGEKDAC